MPSAAYLIQTVVGVHLRGTPINVLPQIAENTQKGRAHGCLLITNIRMFETLVTRVTVVGADAFLLPFRGGRERLRRAPQIAENTQKAGHTEIY